MYLTNVILGILAPSLVTIVHADVSYTKESTTGNGKACLSDCIDYLCLTGWSSTKETCIPGDKPALKYYTARRKTQKDVCVSRCGKFGYDYYWCYVSESEWDYCDPDQGRQVTNVAFTHSKGPCKDACDYHGAPYLWCYTNWGSWDYCDDLKYTYIQSKTLAGSSCVGICGTHDKSYNWCYDGSESWDYCAPPARQVSEFENVKAMVRRVSPLKKNAQCLLPGDLRREKRYVGDEPVEPGFVDGYVQTFERGDNGLLTVDLYDPTNPIYRYTVVPRNYEDEPELPLVVRARITRQTLRHRGAPRASLRADVRRNLERLGLNRDRLDNNNDEIGHLIGHQNGGPNEIYNLAPQTRRLNRDCTHDRVCQQQSVWYWTEMGINAFVRDTGGAVNMTIVVVYRDLRSYTRPDGFAVNLVMYNPDGSVHHECNDYYFSNDPESDSN